MYVIKKAIALSSSTGQTLLIGKLDITEAFNATDLPRAQTAPGDYLADDIAERLVREHWRGRLRLRILGATVPPEPEIRKEQRALTGCNQRADLVHAHHVEGRLGELGGSR